MASEHKLKLPEPYFSAVLSRDVDPLVRAVHPVVREIVKEARDS